MRRLPPPVPQSAAEEKVGTVTSIVNFIVVTWNRLTGSRDRHYQGLLFEREATMMDREAVTRQREATIKRLEKELDASRALGGSNVIALGNRTVAVRLKCGLWIVAPTWNVDVAMGIIRDGIIESWTTSAVERVLKPGDTYVNVGTNIGYYMVLGANAVGRTGRVFAIEANPVLLPYLMKTVHWCGYPDVIRLYNRAVSDEDDRKISIPFDAQFLGGGSVALSRAREYLSSSRIEDTFWENIDLSRFVKKNGSVSWLGGTKVRRECSTARLDTILSGEERIDLLHMDIEGSEPAAIAGAQEVIARSPGMAVIMEWSPYYCLKPKLLTLTENMWEFFERLGYVWYRIRSEDFDPNLVAPRLSPITSRAQLFSTGHADVLIVRDLQTYYDEWPELIVIEEPGLPSCGG